MPKLGPKELGLGSVGEIEWQRWVSTDIALAGALLVSLPFPVSSPALVWHILHSPSFISTACKHSVLVNERETETWLNITLEPGRAPRGTKSDQVIRSLGQAKNTELV